MYRTGRFSRNRLKKRDEIRIPKNENFGRFNRPDSKIERAHGMVGCWGYYGGEMLRPVSLVEVEVGLG